eukprot:scaffold133245_cov50-Attheya_sp.AAC.1
MGSVVKAAMKQKLSHEEFVRPVFEPEPNKLLVTQLLFHRGHKPNPFSFPHPHSPWTFPPDSSFVCSLSFDIVAAVAALLVTFLLFAVA